ncbi:hypothetical protein AV530_003923 [Patagioenas fasciata monilis]|uniref:Uncharacterized protein n=1 Tax=Patagioenas fasciata monilis TaxID=372326 RepID=A0A1V4L0M3_PATFA|nr:hypothetical protein AV530_003923 [Patagioenas fasciata monilis]
MAPPLPNLFSTQVEEYRALKDLWMPPASSGQLASAAFPTPPGPRGSLRQHRPTPGISGTSDCLCEKSIYKFKRQQKGELSEGVKSNGSKLQLPQSLQTRKTISGGEGAGGGCSLHCQY